MSNYSWTATEYETLILLRSFKLKQHYILAQLKHKSPCIHGSAFINIGADRRQSLILIDIIASLSVNVVISSPNERIMPDALSPSQIHI